VSKHYAAFMRECKGGSCEDSIRVLQSFIWPTEAYKVAKNCDFIKLAYDGFEGRYKNEHPPCYRDQIINSAASMLQYVMQGFVIVGFQR